MLKAIVRHAGGYAFLAKANSNHWIPLDASPRMDPEAEDGASRPKELLLLALGGCSAFDVRMILKKRRLEPRGFEVEVTADEDPEPPMVLTRARIVYRFTGEDLPAKDLERAVRLSQDKYCSVSLMLLCAFPIEWVILRNGEEVASGASPDPGAPG